MATPKAIKLPLRVGDEVIYKTYFENYGPEPDGWYNDGDLYLRSSSFGWRWECHAAPCHRSRRAGWSWTQEGAIRRYYEHRAVNDGDPDDAA